MSHLRDIYNNCSELSPLNITNKDKPEYLEKLFLDIKARLSAENFAVDPAASEANFIKGLGYRYFTVYPTNSSSEFSRESAFFKLELNSKCTEFLHDVFSKADIGSKNAEVTFTLHTPTGKKFFPYGASNHDEETATNRTEAREASLDDIVKHIVESLAAENLRIQPTNKPE